MCVFPHTNVWIHACMVCCVLLSVIFALNGVFIVYVFILSCSTLCVCVQGWIQDFSRGDLQAMVMYKLYYIYIAIIHIIILNEVHCNLLKAIDA